jgi:dihydroflavonol-4-reductase
MGTVAVTGASGFIGSAVVRALRDRGRSVRALVEPGADARNLDAVGGAGVDRVSCDVLDGPALRRAISGCDTLYHLAAVYKTWARDRTPIHRVNVEGTTAVLLAALETRVRRVVYTSSVAAVGLVPGGLADEATAFNLFDVADDYILSKWVSERVALRFAEAGLDVVVVNPSFPFGPGDRAPTPTGNIVLSVLRGEVPGWTPGGFNAIDVDDCATGHVLAEEKGRKGERYLLGATNVTLRDFFALVARAGNVRPPRLPLPGSASALYALGLQMVADKVTHEPPAATYRSVRYLQRRAFFSNAKAERELGLRTRPLEVTIRRAVEWFRAEGMVS